MELLRKDGYLGFILPHKFFNAQYGEAIRKLISEGKYLNKIVHFGDQQVFPKVSTYTCLFFLSKTKKSELTFIQVKDLFQWIVDGSTEETLIINESITDGKWDFGKIKNSVVFDKFKTSRFVKLSEIKNNISQGIRTSANKIYVLDLISQEENLLQVYSKALDRIFTIESNLTSLFLQGKEIKPYQMLTYGLSSAKN